MKTPNIRFAFAVNKEESFELKHFGDADKYLIYEFLEGEFKLITEQQNTLKLLDESPNHGSKDKGNSIIKLLKENNVDLVVLARYMQVLTSNFINKYPNKIINIHHSSLPAFAGAKPYNNAYKRGVKLIGATAHYVTEDLDAGPIISQEVKSVSHKESLADLKRKGKNTEKFVLADAIWLHLNHKILSYKNKTIVFS